MQKTLTSKQINGNHRCSELGRAAQVKAGNEHGVPALQRARANEKANGKRGPRFRLTAEDQIVLLRLHEKGRKPATIARVLSRPDRPVSRATVYRYLKAIDMPQAEVQRALAALRMRAVESWETAMRTGEKFGKHTPAKDLLAATGTIRSDAPIDRVVIIVGDGRKAIGELPAIPAQFTETSIEGDVATPILPAPPGAEP